MKTQREVFNKLFKEEKTELETAEKIELAATEFKEVWFSQKGTIYLFQMQEICSKRFNEFKG